LTSPFVSPGRHPHEVAVALYSLLVGIVGFTLPTGISRSIATMFPYGWDYVYFGLLIVAGGMVLIGVFNRKIEGALLERSGLLVLTCLFLAYAIAVMIVGGQLGFVAAMFSLSYSVANVVRAVQITRAINDWRSGG
jgi:hypothetical protein